MMFDRDFLPDSDDSSFSQDSEEEVPRRVSVPEKEVFRPFPEDADFQLENRRSEISNKPVYRSEFVTNEPPRLATPPGHAGVFSTQQPLKGANELGFNPVKQQAYEKVSFVNFEEPRPDTSNSRPPTSARPPSATAAMRANMLKKQREALLGRNAGVTESKANPNFIGLGVAASVSGRFGNAELDQLISSTGNSDLIRSSQGFSPYEPGANRDLSGNAPAPIKPVRAHINMDTEDLVEERFDESSAVKRPASKAIQELHRKAEYDRQKQPERVVVQEENYIRRPEPVVVHKEPVSGFGPTEVIYEPEQYIATQKQLVNHAPPPHQIPVQEPYKQEAQPQYEGPPIQPQYTSPLAKPQYTGPPAEPQYSGPPPQQYTSPPHSQQSPQPLIPPPAYKAAPEYVQSPTHPVQPPPQMTPGRPTSGGTLAETPGETLGNEDSKDNGRAIPRPPSINVQQVLQQEMTDMRRFLTRPVPQGIMLQCNIRRDKSGFKRLAPRYYIYLCEGYTFLLAGKKRMNNKTSNYLISMNQTDLNVKSPSYLGKVRSNFMGTEFNVYDTGLNPTKKKATRANIREQLGTFLYESNLLGSKGPRKMKVLLPAVNSSGERFSWRPEGKNDTMLARFNCGDSSGIFSYFNKPPKWNEYVQAYVLNFGGRVDRASVKNFQLIDDIDENKVYLQFGRVAEHSFNLDFQWPFSPMQAFALALSSFDYKFACE